jgi:hypothetical protein
VWPVLSEFRIVRILEFWFLEGPAIFVLGVFALLNWAVITNAVTVMVLSGLAVLQVGLAGCIERSH